MQAKLWLANTLRSPFLELVHILESIRYPPQPLLNRGMEGVAITDTTGKYITTSSGT